MRKAIGVALVLIGVFGVVLAILLPTVVVSKSKKTPLDLNITQISSGPSTLLDAATGKTNAVESDGANTTVDESLCIVVVTDSNTPNCVRSSDARLLSVTTDRETASRRSAEAVHVAKYHENVNGDTSVRHTGLSYKWPIDAEKKTYQFYQPDVKRAFPAKFIGIDTIRGLRVYKYQSATGDQPYKVQGLIPGTYNDTRTVWVEPRTGAIVNGTEHQVQSFRSQGKSLTALETTLNFEKSAVDYQANYAKGKIDDLRKAQIYGPVGAGVLGITALVVAFLLLRGGRETGRAGRHHAGSSDDGNYGDNASGSGPLLTGSNSQT